jgi:threonine dehydratase
MPSDAPRVKAEATEALGARIVPYERRSESREQIAAAIANETGAIVVPSFDDPDIIAGQGTLGLEMAAQAQELGAVMDYVLVPCSGGGLASGTALAFSGRSPATRIVVAEPAGFDGTRLSLERGERVAAAGTRSTIADALMSTAPGVLPFALLKALEARGVAVDDADLTRAVAFAALNLKLIVEPGGAAGLAALLSGKFPAQGKTVGVVLSGGNIDPAMLTRCLANASTPGDPDSFGET